MKYLLILCLFISASGWSQIKHQIKVSRSIPGKTNQEIKEIVLYSGALDAIRNVAPSLGFNYDVFIKKLNARFETFFELHKEHQLIQKFGKQYLQTLPLKDRQAFIATLNEKRDALFQKFSKLSETIQSYDVKSEIVELVLDKAKIERLLRRTIQHESLQYSKIWILTEINLNGLSWEHFELATAGNFKDPIENSWLKWLSEHLPPNVEEVGICRGVCLETYSAWEQKRQDEVVGLAGPEFLNGVWAKITLNLKQGLTSSLLIEKRFEWDGRMVFLEVNTKRVLGSIELPPEKRNFQASTQKKVNSDLASLLYRSGIGGFVNLSDKLKNHLMLNRVSRLSIRGQKHLQDVQLLLEEMKVRGSSLGLHVQMDFFNAKEAQVLCFYQGEEKSFTDLLSRLKELKLSKSYKIMNELNGTQNVLKLVAE